jgi:hypothetical protein
MMTLSLGFCTNKFIGSAGVSMGPIQFSVTNHVVWLIIAACIIVIIPVFW